MKISSGTIPKGNGWYGTRRATESRTPVLKSSSKEGASESSPRIRHGSSASVYQKKPSSQDLRKEMLEEIKYVAIDLRNKQHKKDLESIKKASRKQSNNVDECWITVNKEPNETVEIGKSTASSVPSLVPGDDNRDFSSPIKGTTIETGNECDKTLVYSSEVKIPAGTELHPNVYDPHFNYAFCVGSNYRNTRNNFSSDFGSAPSRKQKKKIHWTKQSTEKRDSFFITKEGRSSLQTFCKTAQFHSNESAHDILDRYNLLAQDFGDDVGDIFDTLVDVWCIKLDGRIVADESEYVEKACKFIAVE